ncbi:hypothetical protein UFOVP135_21 [uncultured Caudovirales phage]|uniref:Uncharacterized protein n=1 Tax=uncultured Caudovirales phage TaxID=2100421 RepID=A0A6J5LD68_9CAUD|nr:hypothetical protein UFOVP135_21 [uncultured Caudovirales phage]
MSILALTSDTLIGTPAAGNIEYNGQFYGTDSNNARAQMQRITQGTAVASTSGTSIDFTALPSWIKRITVLFNGVSTNGTSILLLQIGAGSVINTGYVSAASVNATNVAQTTGYGVLGVGSAAYTVSGAVRITNITGNTWVSDGVLSSGAGGNVHVSGGTLALSGTLDRVRITTVNGTDTFDAGSINILYEG